MAVYKVPQDVEAEDKLIGPFSFRQFIYLIVVAIGIALAWFLGRIFIGLILIPMPVILFFGALALPLRKDQPMEIYLAAVVRFFFKPRLRLWQPEGQVNLVTIIAPHVIEAPLTKDFSGDEAQQKLSYLAQVIDTQGWAARGVTDTSMASLRDTVTAEASTINDVMDTSIGIGQQFDSLIEEQDAMRKQQVTEQFQAAMQQPPSMTTPFSTDPYTSAPSNRFPAPAVASSSGTTIDYNPYPTSMRQHVISPHGAPQSAKTPTPPPVPDTITIAPANAFPMPPAQSSAPQQGNPPQLANNRPVNASSNQPSADIMRLANNRDLSISAIAREAHRLNEDDGDEVVISLR